MGGKKKKTHEEFINEVFSIAGNKYIFHSEYNGADNRIDVECKIDGYRWQPTAHAFLHNKCKCPKCSNCVQNKDTNYFKQEVYNLYGNEYVVKSEYNGARNKVKILHNINGCNHIFTITPDSFLNKKARCPKCSHKSRIEKLLIGHEEFIKRIKELHSDDFEILSEYKGGKQRVLVRHKKCNRIFETFAGDLLQGKGCRYCCGTMQKTHQEFVDEMVKSWGKEYTVLSEYLNAKTKVLVRHNVCGKEWEVYPYSIVNKHGCSDCISSTAEVDIRNFLEFNKIKYIKQYTFGECKHVNPLPFDFAVFNDNNQLVYLIEYDGVQHYKPVSFGGKKSSKEAKLDFEQLKFRDSIKTEFCSKNNIKLLRIPYFKKNNMLKIILDHLSDYFYKELEIPSEYIIPLEKNIYLNFIELMKTLPNGYYSKQWVLSQITDNSSFYLCKVYKNEMVKKLIAEIGIEIEPDYLSITNNYIDFDKYFILLSEQKFVAYIQKVIYILKDLSIGIHTKDSIKKLFNRKNCFITMKILNDKVFNQFLSYKNIVINNKFVKVG